MLVVNHVSPDIPGALDFVAGRRIMEIDRRPLEITRRVPTLRVRLSARVPLPNSRPLLKSCHSFSSSTHRIFTIRVNYSYYCWGTTHATSLCRRGRAVEPVAGRMKVLGGAGVSYRYEKQLISVNPVCLATPNYPWNNRGA